MQNNYCIDLFCVESCNFLIYEPTLKWAHFEFSLTGVDNKVMIGDLDITMLDMFGLQSEWRGMGHSLLRKGYNNTISDTQRRISNNILRGGLRFLQR